MNSALYCQNIRKICNSTVGVHTTLVLESSVSIRIVVAGRAIESGVVHPSGGEAEESYVLPNRPVSNLEMNLAGKEFFQENFDWQVQQLEMYRVNSFIVWVHVPDNSTCSSQNVREAFVQSARLLKVTEVCGRLGHSVGQFVANDSLDIFLLGSCTRL